MTKRKSDSRAYRIWAGMKQRCTNPNHAAWKHYGGRGITVCDRWAGRGGFDAFLADMGEPPDGHSLDRIDNDGNYEPGNCRWATSAQQGANKYRALAGIRVAFLGPSFERKQALKALDEATPVLHKLIPVAVEAGASIAEVARWAGMTRKAIYDVLERHDADPDDPLIRSLLATSAALAGGAGFKLEEDDRS